MSVRDWSVVIVEEGRAGSVIYREPGHELRFWWEFGGGDAVAMIAVGTAAEWAQKHAWAAARRAELIARITDEVIRQRAPGCIGTLDDRGWITLTPRQGAAAAGGGGNTGRDTPREGSPTPPAANSASANRAADSPAARHFAVSSRKASIVGIVAVVLIALSAVAWLGRSALHLRTTGSPRGRSMRSGILQMHESAPRA